MKKIYLLFSVMFIGVQFSNAQLTLTKSFNEPVVGDVQIEVSYDSTSAVPKSMGTGQNWNFTTFTLNTMSSYTETVTYTTTSSVPQSSIAPGCTLAGDRGSGKYDFYKASTTNFEYVGQYDPSPNYFYLSNGGIFFTWPVNYGSTISDPFSGIITTSSGTMSINGTVTHSATGTGTVTMPSGNKHTNCLQYIETVMFTITQGTTTVQTQNQIKYMYFSSSMKLPIAELSYQTQTSGTVTSKSVNMMFNQNALAAGVNEIAEPKTGFSVYPNPASQQVSVSLPEGSSASTIEIIDLNGRVVLKENNTNTVNVSKLSKGVYTVKVTSKNGTLQKPLIISE